MKKVSIIIPFKGQTLEELAIPLGSINNQIGVNFDTVDVHLVNDGGESIDTSAFKIFKNLEINYHELPENVGAGLARQYGMDHSESEYMMFMDSDDSLHFVGALLEFFNVVKYYGEHQLIIARYLEQFKNGEGEFRYITHPNADWKSPVAKWFNRAYIEASGLRFHPDLRIYEDTYFVGLSCELATDIYYLDSVVYSWLYREGSTVRSAGRIFEYQTHTWALENRLYLEVIEQRLPKNLQRDLNNYVTDVYMRYTVYPPVDEAAFWEEHEKLLARFAYAWQGYTAELQAQVDALRDAEEGQWRGVATEGFKEFVEKGSAHKKQ